MISAMHTYRSSTELYVRTAWMMFVWQPHNPFLYLLTLSVVFQVFIKSELKVGVMYVRENQCSEETILANNDHSPQFEEFLTIIGEKVRLKGGLPCAKAIQSKKEVLGKQFGVCIQDQSNKFL